MGGANFRPGGEGNTDSNFQPLTPKWKGMPSDLLLTGELMLYIWGELK